MPDFVSCVLAGLTSPENVGTTPMSLILLLPIVASIAVVYKATKLPHISAANFIKESVLLFGSIVVFMIFTALVLAAAAWLITG